MPLKKYSQVRWTKSIDNQLGRLTDREIAKRYGILPRAARQRRVELEVPSANRRQRTPSIRWTISRDRLLGTMPDTKLAERLGTTAYHVRARRYELGVDPYKTPPPPPADADIRKAQGGPNRTIVSWGPCPIRSSPKDWDLDRRRSHGVDWSLASNRGKTGCPSSGRLAC